MFMLHKNRDERRSIALSHTINNSVAVVSPLVVYCLYSVLNQRRERNIGTANERASIMVTAIDDANAAASNTLSLLVQSDSSDDDDDDDSVEKTSTGVANATITDKECRSTKSLADASLFANKDESSKKTHRRRLSNNARSMTSFDIEETSPSPTKKRRVHSEHQKGGSGHVWDGFVRRGTCLKGLFQDAMQLAASHQEGVVSDGDEEGEVDMRRRMTSEQHNHAADIAREKTAGEWQKKYSCVVCDDECMWMPSCILTFTLLSLFLECLILQKVRNAMRNGKALL